MIQIGAKKDAHATLDQPLDHLVACHGRIEDRLAALERAAAHLEDRPAEARETIAGVFRYFETSGVLHTRDEEESVFPRLHGRLTAEDLEYIARLESQHREADAIYERIKNCPPEDGDTYRALVARFCELYRAHIASENSELIAMARRALREEELAEISKEMKQRRGM